MLLQNSGTRLPPLMNTSGFHRNVGEGNKSFNAMSPDPYLSEAFGMVWLCETSHFVCLSVTLCVTFLFCPVFRVETLSPLNVALFFLNRSYFGEKANGTSTV